MKIPVKSGNISPKVRQRAKLLFPVFGAALLLMSIVIGIIFFFFQKIALNSLAQQDAEFARQIETLGSFTENMIQQYGLQIFYDPGVAGLLEEENVSEMERVYDMRTLNAYDRSRNFLDSVFIYNKYEEQIYSTDSQLLSAPIDEFADKSAIELFKNLDVEERMTPIRRVAFPGEDREKRYFSFLFYDTTYMDEPKGSVLMLNVDEEWYLDNLTRLYGLESCVLLDKNGDMLTKNPPETNRLLSIFMDDILSENSSESRYMLKKYRGNEIVCLYSRVRSSQWFCIRVLPLNQCLPGFISLRDGIAIGIGISFAILGLAIAITLIYLYLPILQLRKALKKTGGNSEYTDIEINRLVQDSSEYQNAYALRNILEKRPVSTKVNIIPPMSLVLMENGSGEEIREIISHNAPESLLDRQHNCDVLLLMGKNAHRGKEICAELAEKAGCRCFCGAARNNISELPGCYQILNEMRFQQFWYSGQRILSETDFCCTKQLRDETRELPGEILSTLKNRNLKEAEAMWHKLLKELQGSSHVEQLVIFHNLAELLESALPELKPLAGDDFFRNLKDISELEEKYLGAFKKIAEYYQAQRTSHYSEIIQKAQNLIDKNYKDPNLSPASIGDELNMSSAYLGRIFREILGSSINQYINETRVKSAEELLKNSELPVEAIAEGVGFSNVKYFYVVFKNICGMTPLQYRKSKSE